MYEHLLFMLNNYQNTLFTINHCLINPLKHSGNYVSQTSKQPVKLYFVLVGSVCFMLKTMQFYKYVNVLLFKSNSYQNTISTVLSHDENLLQTNTSYIPTFCFHPVYCLIRYLTVWIIISVFITTGRKRLRCQVMFENEHTLCSWKHHLPT
jgi:hypothetical protein